MAFPSRPATRRYATPRTTRDGASPTGKGDRGTIPARQAIIEQTSDRIGIHVAGHHPGRSAGTIIRIVESAEVVARERGHRGLVAIDRDPVGVMTAVDRTQEGTVRLSKISS